MRVLQFGRYWNENFGGLERHVQLLSKGLAAQGVDVVNLVAASGINGSDEILDGYRLVRVPSFGTVFSTAMAPTLVLKALSLHREKPFDIIHLHFPDPLSHLASLFLPASIKRVITWHSDIVRQKRLLALYRPLLQRFTRSADALVAATQMHYESSTQIPADMPATRRHVIPYGLNYSSLALTPSLIALRDAIRSKANGRPVIFALGRHVYYKGFDVLIEAMRHVDAYLVLGGEGPLRSQLQAQAVQIGVSHKVWFVGRIPEVELPAYFHACDVFCFPSVEQSEAFGLVQLEAMACGKPVVCSQLENGVNVVNLHQETGLAVPVRDPVALGGALMQLLRDDSLRSRLGEQAKVRAYSLYSLSAMTTSHMHLYKSLFE